MTNAREEEKNDVDAVFVCFFVSARVVRLFVPLTCRSKALSLTIVFLLRTSAIQTSLIALGLLSVRKPLRNVDLKKDSPTLRICRFITTFAVVKSLL